MRICTTTFCQESGSAPQFTKITQKVYYEQVIILGSDGRRTVKEYSVVNFLGCGCVA